MKTVFTFFLLLALSACTGNRIAYNALRNNAVSSSEACEIIAKKQQTQYRIAKREAKKNHRMPVIAKRQSNKTVVSLKDDDASQQLVLAPVITTELQKTEPVSDNNKEETFSKTNGATEKKITRIKSGKKVQPVTYPDTESEQQVKTVKRSSVFRGFKTSSQTLLIIALAGLAGMGLLKSAQRKSMALSHWGAYHPVLARSFIVGAQSVATIGGIALGQDLYNDGIIIPELAKWTALGAFTAAASFYPNSYVGGNIPAFSYARRKFHDIALYTSGAMMMVYAGNHYDITTRQPVTDQTVCAVSLSGNSQSTISLVKKDFSQITQTEEPKKEWTRGEKIGATIFAAIGFAVLSILVAALSCSIACSGNEAAAIAVLVGGEALVIWGLIASIRGIHGMSKKKKVEVSPVTGS